MLPVKRTDRLFPKFEIFVSCFMFGKVDNLERRRQTGAGYYVCHSFSLNSTIYRLNHPPYMSIIMSMCSGNNKYILDYEAASLGLWTSVPGSFSLSFTN